MQQQQQINIYICIVAILIIIIMLFIWSTQHNTTCVYQHFTQECINYTYRDSGGFFSNFNAVVAGMAYTHNHKKVFVTFNSKGIKHGDQDTWSHLFNDPTGIIPGEYKCLTMEAQYDSTTIRFTADNTHNLYISHDNTWRNTLNNAFSKIKVKPNIQQKIDDFAHIHFQGFVIGCHIRSQVIASEQYNKKTVTPSLYIDEIKNKVNQLNLQEYRIFLATDNVQALQTFKEHFSDDIMVFHDHTLVQDGEDHYDLPSDVQNAADVFMDACWLSMTNYFIHGVSNVATAALYMNPLLDHKYLYVS